LTAKDLSFPLPLAVLAPRIPETRLPVADDKGSSSLISLCRGIFRFCELGLLSFDSLSRGSVLETGSYRPIIRLFFQSRTDGVSLALSSFPLVFTGCALSRPLPTRPLAIQNFQCNLPARRFAPTCLAVLASVYASSCTRALRASPGSPILEILY